MHPKMGSGVHLRILLDRELPARGSFPAWVSQVRGRAAAGRARGTFRRMSSELRASTIELLEELCEPVGPWVFSGFGGRIARLRHETAEASGTDLLAGNFAAETCVREVMQAWADEVPLPAAFTVLLDTVLKPPRLAVAQAWRDQGIELLGMCAVRDVAGFRAALRAYAEDPGMASVGEEVEELLAEGTS